MHRKEIFDLMCNFIFFFSVDQYTFLVEKIDVSLIFKKFIYCVNFELKPHIKFLRLKNE